MAQKSEINWKAINKLGEGYIQILKKRVSFELRQKSLEDQELIDSGLAYVEIKKAESDEDIEEEEDIEEGHKPKKIRMTRKVKLVENTEQAKKKADKLLKEGTEEANEKAKKLLEKDTEEIKEKAKNLLKTVRQSREYVILLKHILRQKQEEKELLTESLELFDSSRLWKWCLSVKGLGEVAGMTYASFFNPDKLVINKKTGQLELVRIENIWANAGLIPNAKFKRGEVGHHDPQMKGRLRGVVEPNVIRANDPYYKGFYDLKKDYYMNRPDILDYYANKKGIKGKCNNMAQRVLCKLLMSHAFELMLDPGDRRGNIAARHRNPVPIKSEFPEDWPIVHKQYRDFHTQILEILKEKWIPVIENRKIWMELEKKLKDDDNPQIPLDERQKIQEKIIAAKNAEEYERKEYDNYLKYK